MKRRWQSLVLSILFVASLMTSSLAATTLYWGSKGEDVRRVQQKLIQWGYMTGTADGVFGADTSTAVKKFQSKNGLTPDGLVGASTAAAMGITLGGSSGTTTASTTSSRGGTVTSSDLNLLARVVHGEARGEPYIGKVAVAAVVLNRVAVPQFPNTVAGVVYQPGAFTCVADGQINLAPDEESYRAARDAMAGWDPSGGCLYYYNPKTATQGWIYSRTTRIVIGNHRFAM